MKKIILATAVAMGMVSSAFAVTAQSGVYLTGNLGWSFPSTFSNSSMNTVYGATDASKKDQHLGAGAALGYDYAITQNFLAGAEIGYTYFGKTTYSFTPAASSNTEIKSKYSGLQLLATGTYLDQSGFNIFAKAGAVDLLQSNSVSGSAISAPPSQHKWLPTLGAGVGYMPIQNLNVALQYQRVFGNNSTNSTTNNTDTKPHSQNLVSLGVTYKFAM